MGVSRASGPRPGRKPTLKPFMGKARMGARRAQARLGRRALRPFANFYFTGEG